MTGLLKLLLLVFQVGFVLSFKKDYVSYDNYKVYNVLHCGSDIVDKYTLLKQQKYVNNDGSDFCMQTYLVPPHKELKFLGILRSAGINKFNLTNDNLGRYVCETLFF
ncbi:hypothetical protein Phum_PHUM019650 [Pediculus humanus corporis]|uniref:Uncharacterized protein n=1 Tax=Pediculus humanus subsp. corporis TaxID=121224 RepID=E0V9S2_PEDHC|nr:uncharacterized protein Phum_PHUM019650 [Pediculus humanus corporis]EEB10128.1 hypothetical protein Phum_PHUM019650 [Pediculus humanus corporis]